ncbi:homoserine kinase [SAR202 cluster bacterium AD-802-E10_MRT_200m]|nr:homoserine kinase [SAR202 cluster bacterium AD-802-E10_MRT_200m]
MFQNVKVKVPATTANLGPGFDCLGLALNLWNVLEVTIGPPEINISGEGEDTLSRNTDNLVYRSIECVFQEVGITLPDIKLDCLNAIPLARGLGSSSAAVVAGLVAANVLLDQPLGNRELLRLATSIEGHPDNVAPALLGGCQLVVQSEERLITTPITFSDLLRAVIFVPDVAMPTAQARSLLSPEVSRNDAIFNLSRLGLLVNAFVTDEFKDLKIATEDRLHQPQRRILFPAMELIFKSALKAGALGVFLSGAGSSILALTKDRETTIGYEMADIAEKAGVTGTFRILNLSKFGAHLADAQNMID